MKVKTRCSACGGTGMRPSESLTETMQALDFSEWKSTEKVYALCQGHEHMGQTAINNRLNILFDLGFVLCEKRGRTKFWKASPFFNPETGMEDFTPAFVSSLPFTNREDLTKTTFEQRPTLYLLYRDETLLYIGQTGNPTCRVIKEHAKKPFNRIRFFYLNNKIRTRVEKRLIEQLKPTLNRFRWPQSK